MKMHADVGTLAAPDRGKRIFTATCTFVGERERP
jgi:hypothetical protein